MFPKIASCQLAWVLRDVECLQLREKLEPDLADLRAVDGRQELARLDLLADVDRHRADDP